MPHPGRPFFAHPDFDPELPADNQPRPGSESNAQQEPPAETTSAPEPRLYAGKYKTPEELEAAYGHSFTELQRIQQGYEQQLAAERQRVDALIAGMREPEQPADPFAGLAEVGIPPEVIANAVRTEARRIAREEAEAAIRPHVVSTASQNRVAKQYPDFPEISQQIADELLADPRSLATYNRMFAADPDAAMEWAYLRHRAAHPASTKRVSAADEPTEGAITSQRTTAARTESPDADRASEEARGLKYLRTYGDPTHYLRARFKGMIPDSHFKE